MPSEKTGDFQMALNHARVLLKQGKYELALDQANEILKTRPGDTSILFLKGVVLRRLGHHEASRDLLAGVVREVPELAAAQQELGLVLFTLRQVITAKKHLKLAVNLDRSLAAAWNTLGEIYAIEGNGEKSSEAYRNQLAASNKHPAMLQAVELVGKGKLGMAEGICRDYLQRFPTDVSAIRLLAEIGLKLGIYPEARKLLERCLELAPDYHLARNNYANVLGKAHEFERALKEIAYLEKVEPNNLSHPVLAASLLANVGDFDQALAKYESLLIKVPDHARLQTSYGHALKTVGRQEDCIAAYRQAIAVDPTLGEAYWSLANLKTFRFEKPELKAMKAVIAKDGLGSSDRMHLCFALAKGLEDNGEYDASFNFYTRGNKIQKRESSYQADDTTGRMEKTIEHCTATLFEDRKGFGHPAPDAIFIVGLPRSGSTLLEQILASHSEVEGTMELPYIDQIARQLGGKTKKTDKSMYPQILAELSEEQCVELGQQFLDAARVQRSGTPFFIDKMPNNFAHVGLISLILPRAKIIDARRHPMATCFSSFKQLFAAGQHFTYSLEDIGRYYSDYVKLMDHFDEVLPGKVLRVGYEEVVRDFEQQVRGLLDFCELDFEPACLQFYKSERAVRTASSEQVRQPIYSDALEQWKHFESHLGPLKETLSGLQHRYPF